MISAIVSRLVILLFGTLYPAYASYKAVRTKNVKEYVKWMMYWIVFALFTCAETFTDVLLSFWFPCYYEIKVVLVIWLLSPATKGSSILYRNFVHPALIKREQEIDEYISKAKEQGYHTMLHLGSKGVTYATSVIMQTAIKGGGGIVNHLRRSYSLSDLSGDSDLKADLNRNSKLQGDSVDSADVPRDLRMRTQRKPGGSHVDLYFPEMDVDIRSHPHHSHDLPVNLSQIRSSEDISSGYSSAEPLFGEGQIGPEGNPLMRTASVGATRARPRPTRATAQPKKALTTEDEADDFGVDCGWSQAFPPLPLASLFPELFNQDSSGLPPQAFLSPESLQLLFANSLYRGRMPQIYEVNRDEQSISDIFEDADQKLQETIDVTEPKSSVSNIENIDVTEPKGSVSNIENIDITEPKGSVSINENIDVTEPKGSVSNIENIVVTEPKGSVSNIEVTEPKGSISNIENVDKIQDFYSEHSASPILYANAEHSKDESSKIATGSEGVPLVQVASKIISDEMLTGNKALVLEESKVIEQICKLPEASSGSKVLLLEESKVTEAKAPEASSESKVLILEENKVTEQNIDKLPEESSKDNDQGSECFEDASEGDFLPTIVLNEQPVASSDNLPTQSQSESLKPTASMESVASSGDQCFEDSLPDIAMVTERDNLSFSDRKGKYNKGRAPPPPDVRKSAEPEVVSVEENQGPSTSDIVIEPDLIIGSTMLSHTQVLKPVTEHMPVSSNPKTEYQIQDRERQNVTPTYDRRDVSPTFSSQSKKDSSSFSKFLPKSSMSSLFNFWGPKEESSIVNKSSNTRRSPSSGGARPSSDTFCASAAPSNIEYNPAGTSDHEHVGSVTPRLKIRQMSHSPSRRRHYNY